MPSLGFRTKFELVRQSIHSDIVSGVLPIADTLPSEDELGRRYGVNRGTVNKALGALESQGLISRKPRVGSRVLAMRDRKATSQLAALMMLNAGHVFADLHTHMVQAIQRNHYYPVLLDIAPGMEPESERVGFRNYVAGLLNVFPEFLAVDGMCNLPFDLLHELSGKIHNLIFFNRFESDRPFSASYVLSDYEHGGYLAARHLIEAGCRRIAFAAYNLEKPFVLTSQLCQGLRRAHAEAGLVLEGENVIGCDFSTAEPKLERLVDRFKRAPRPDAVFADSDFFARRVQGELEKLGLTMGVDYRMVGYCNTPWATEGKPELTSVSINEEGIAEAFADLVGRRGYLDCERIMVKPKLVVRDAWRKKGW